MARRKLWIPINQGLSVAAGASVHTDMISSLAGPDVEAIGGLTVERIIGNVTFRCDVVGTYQQFDMAIGVLPEELGITTNMSISSDARNWLWTLMTRTWGAFTEVGAGDFDGVEERVYIDVRGKRKIPANSRLVFVVGNGGGETLTYNIGIRTLVLLP